MRRSYVLLYAISAIFVCVFQVVEEVGRHITFRYEGVLPLADQGLLALLDILVNKADIMQVIKQGYTKKTIDSPILFLSPRQEGGGCTG